MFGPNIPKLAYLSFRLAPFIIVCFFVLDSLMYQHISGIIYLAGILITCMLTIMLSNMFSPGNAAPSTGSAFPTEPIGTVCNTIALGAGGMYLSNIPLSIVIFSFTFIYLLVCIYSLGMSYQKLDKYSIKESMNMAFKKHTTTMVIFPLLLIMDVFWNVSNGCADGSRIVIAGLIGGVFGLIWASLMSNNPKFLYFGEPDTAICSRPTKIKYRCTTDR